MYRIIPCPFLRKDWATWLVSSDTVVYAYSLYVDFLDELTLVAFVIKALLDGQILNFVERMSLVHSRQTTPSKFLVASHIQQSAAVEAVVDQAELGLLLGVVAGEVDSGEDR